MGTARLRAVHSPLAFLKGRDGPQSSAQPDCVALKVAQVDLREYGVAAHILRDLGVGSIRLMTNNPAKLNSLKAYGFQVSERLPLLPGAVAAIGAAPVQPSKPKVPAAHSPARHRNGSDPHFV